MNTIEEISIFWFRRDLRLADNAGLYHALKGRKPVLPIFIFDTAILSTLEDKQDARVDFIYQNLQFLQQEVRGFGSALLIEQGEVLAVFQRICQKYSVQAVYVNGDYEPYAQERDTAIKHFLEGKGIPFYSSKDQVIFEKHEVVKDDKSPYTVFTPYMKRWKATLTAAHLEPYPCEKYFANFLKWQPESSISLTEIGFQPSGFLFSRPHLDSKVVSNYHETRDFPGIEGTSRLSVHLRFGTVSIRALTQNALKLNEKWWNELIWREFYMMILFHFPHVVHSAFKKQYNAIPWRNNEEEYNLWCAGKTGYPIVDAGMRELNHTGFMHNRVRMVVASFLVKHLLIDWKWGEAYFAKKLLDFELASNNGGWQWAAGSGCDAAPYFRVFNPYEQTKKFDPGFVYIGKWVPELEEMHYPKPIVEHKFARERVLKTYKEALNKESI